MNRKRLLLQLGFAGGVAVVASLGLSAATVTAPLAVSANVAHNCTISTSAIAFGAYDPLVANSATGADLAGNGTVTFACTKGTTPTVALDNGGGGAGGRRMTAGGADALTYDLYKDNTYGNRWGDSGAELVSPGAIGRAGTTLTVYGRVPKDQNVAAGNYTDSVTATITF